jgi:hypothetical protein
MNGPKATCALSPFDSQLRTLVGAARRSHSCPQKRTHAPQQTFQKATRAIDPLLRDTDLFHHWLPQLLFPADEFGRLSR